MYLLYFSGSIWNKWGNITSESFFFSVLSFCLSLFIVWGGRVSSIQCGTCVRTQLKPDSTQSPAPSFSVWRTRPCCCPLGQPSGLHTGKTMNYILNLLFFKFEFIFFAGQLSDCSVHHQIKTKRTNDTSNANAHSTHFRPHTWPVKQSYATEVKLLDHILSCT